MPAGVSDAKASKSKKDENRVKRRSLGPRGQSQSCHQCRQSIFSTNGARDSQTGKDRLKCSSCTRFWCEKCLENRYGIHKTIMGANWKCPFCSGQCNCSVCRRKEGKLATGVLSPLARNAGYSSVSEFLDKGTDQVAKCLHWKASSLMTSRESPLRSPSGTDGSGYFTKSMQLSVEKLNPSMLKRGAPSLPSKARQGVKRRHLHHTLYSISVEEEDDDVGDTSDVKSKKSSEMTSCKLGKSNCPETCADGTLEGVVGSSKMAESVVTEGNDRRSENRVPSGDIRPLGHLTPPSTSCSRPPVIVDKRKRDQLPGSVKGEGITQAQTHIKVGKHKEHQDEEGAFLGNAVKKFCTMQVHPEDKDKASMSKVYPSGTVPSTVANIGGSTKSPGMLFLQEASPLGMQLVKAKNVYHTATCFDLGGPSKDSHGPANLNDEVSRPAEFMAGNMAAVLNSLSVSKDGVLGKVKLTKLDQQKAREKEEREKAKLKLKEDRAISKMKEKQDRENEKMKMKEKMKEEREIVRQKLKEDKKLMKLKERELVQERKEEERRKIKEDKDQKRHDMQRELKELKLQKKKEWAEAVKLPSAGAGEEQEVSFLEDDSVERCLECGIPDLPPLRPLDVGVPWGDVPRFLFVCEFLHTFGSVLKLRRATSLSRFQALLPNGRGMNDVYQCLLQAVLDPASHVTNQPSQLQSHVTSQLLADKKQPRDMEKLVAEYLHASGRNGFIATSSGAPTLEQTLVMLEHLCMEALDSTIISDYIQSSVAKVEEMKRKKRLSLKEKIRDCSEELEHLCEEGVSLEELKEKRDQFAVKLMSLRRKLDCERLKNALILRNPPLGTDRHSRVYWKLQCSEGLLIEIEPQTPESSSSEVRWAIMESRDEVKEFIGCLHPRGRREGSLLEKIKDAVGLYGNCLASDKPIPPQATQ